MPQFSSLKYIAPFHRGLQLWILLPGSIWILVYCNFSSTLGLQFLAITKSKASLFFSTFLGFGIILEIISPQFLDY